ncbi:WYL domain-containing protein [Pedobacter aquatilis]|uniref:helix-turn-helix transcriptional regulator n=1 Tax=Pedobacter aquatilis TaxID=351343 RepID=UPI00292E7237|nr:WYL domain-containing protein [Pedobacter aquatilis]
MSKREITLRQTAIINRLKKSPATLAEIFDYLSRESELLDYKLSTSRRTFQRDCQDILSLYNISIACNKAKNEYYLSEQEDNSLSNRMLDAFNIFNALNSSKGMSEYLDFEHLADRGAEHFYALLHAVKNNLQTTIQYQSYWDDQPKERIIEPYFFKEFKNRWYLIANDKHKQQIRTFAFDRIKALDISKKRFSSVAAKKSRNYFEHSFGIISQDLNEPLEAVLLSFNAFQGQYIKSLPLHSSQRIIKDNEDELLIELLIHPTFDLEMQILSYAENVKVLAPESLKKSIRKRIKDCYEQYKED